MQSIKELIEKIETGFAGVWVKASERLPANSDTGRDIPNRTTGGTNCIGYYQNESDSEHWRQNVYEWLDPSPETKAALIAALQTKEFEENSDEEWFESHSKPYYDSWEGESFDLIDKDTFLKFCQHIRSTELAAAKKQIEELKQEVSFHRVGNRVLSASVTELKEENDLLRQKAEAQIKSNQSLSRMPDKVLMDEMATALEDINHSLETYPMPVITPNSMLHDDIRRLLTKHKQSK